MRHGKLSTDTLDVTAQIAGPARLTDSGDLLTGSFAEMESGGQLNPALSLWLMGFPPEWENYAPAKRRKYLCSRYFLKSLHGDRAMTTATRGVAPLLHLHRIRVALIMLPLTLMAGTNHTSRLALM